MDLETLKELFDAKFEPIYGNLESLRGDLKELKTSQIEFSKTIATNSESITNLKKDVKECSDCVDDLKKNSDKKMWSVLLMLLTCICGVIGVIVGRYF